MGRHFYLTSPFQSFRENVSLFALLLGGRECTSDVIEIIGLTRLERRQMHLTQSSGRDHL